MINQNKRNSRYFTYIEPVLKTPIVKTYGSLVFTILAMIVFVLFAIKPTIETIVVLQKDLDNQTEILNKLKQKTNDIQTAKSNLNKIDSSTRGKITSLLPKNSELPGLVRVLEQSVPTGASISAIQFQPLTIADPSQSLGSQLTTIDFTFNIEGSYDSIRGVLQNLQGGTRLISITNLVINKIENSKGLLMSVTGKAYYLK